MNAFRIGSMTEPSRLGETRTLIRNCPWLGSPTNMRPCQSANSEPSPERISARFSSPRTLVCQLEDRTRSAGIAKIGATRRPSGRKKRRTKRWIGERLRVFRASGAGWGIEVVKEWPERVEGSGGRRDSAKWLESAEFGVQSGIGAERTVSNFHRGAARYGPGWLHGDKASSLPRDRVFQRGAGK